MRLMSSEEQHNQYNNNILIILFILHMCVSVYPSARPSGNEWENDRRGGVAKSNIEIDEIFQ